jgi:hypothetical protein
MVDREVEVKLLKALSQAISDDRFNRDACMMGYYKAKILEAQEALDAFLKETE